MKNVELNNRYAIEKKGIASSGIRDMKQVGGIFIETANIPEDNEMYAEDIEAAVEFAKQYK